MFPDILVPVSGQESGWYAVAQAVELAHCEKARLLGLHVVRSQREREGEAVRAVQAEFARRCAEWGVQGSLAVDVGRIARTICERSRWADLVVVNLSHPPGPRSLGKLSSGFRRLLRCSATPVLAVPAAPSRLQRPLLAYDGSPTAHEALYVAAYLAAGCRADLTIVSVQDNGQVTPAVLEEARSYLQARGVEGAFVLASGAPAAAILNAAQRFDCDLILMGSYGLSPVMEVVLGSAVDQVLRESQQPILICR
jgi:nucleotide-binding universal stress UspA family protein